MAAIDAGDLTRNWPLRILLAFVAVAMAAVSMLAALNMSAGRVAPENFVGMWPKNGLTIARAANRSLASTMSGSEDSNSLPKVVSEKTVDLSKAALLYEPLSVASLRNLGYAASADGDTFLAERIMLASSKLSRRDAGTNLWLIDHFGRASDLERTFEHYDLLLRTNSRAPGAMLPLMAKALSAPGAVGIFEDLLGRDPPWAPDFWAAVVENGQVAIPAAKLREGLYRKGIAMEPHYDSYLLGQLVQNGSIRQARALYSAASRKLGARANGLLADPSFESEPVLTPFDWDIVQGEDYGSSLDTEVGILRVNSLPKGKGVFLQQLVALVPGKYQIELSFDGSADFGRDAVKASLVCAELSGDRTYETRVPLVPGRTSVLTVSGPCRQFWVSLELDATNEPNGLDFRLAEVRFAKA